MRVLHRSSGRARHLSRAATDAPLGVGAALLYAGAGTLTMTALAFFFRLPDVTVDLISRNHWRLPATEYDAQPTDDDLAQCLSPSNIKSLQWRRPTPHAQTPGSAVHSLSQSLRTAIPHRFLRRFFAIRIRSARARFFWPDLAFFSRRSFHAVRKAPANTSSFAASSRI